MDSADLDRRAIRPGKGLRWAGYGGDGAGHLLSQGFRNQGVEFRGCVMGTSAETSDASAPFPFTFFASRFRCVLSTFSSLLD